MSIPCDKTLLLVTGSRSSVKAKIEYQGHSFRKKMAVAGALVFHLLVPSSKSSVKVKIEYQGHSFRKKIAIAGALVFHNTACYLLKQYAVLSTLTKENFRKHHGKSSNTDSQRVLVVTT